MSWLEYLLYGFVSGLSEFLPISSQAHQQIMEKLLGSDQRSPLLTLVIHVAILSSIFLSCRTLLEHVRRDRRFSQRNGRRYSGVRNSHMDIQLVKTALIPLIVSVVFHPLVSGWGQNLPVLSLFLLINGVILYIPNRTVRGNKTARAMTGFDGLLIGIGGALGVFPGISRMAGSLSAATVRGANARSAFNWAILLSIPALCILIVLDILSFATNSHAVVFELLGTVFTAIGAFVGGYLSAAFMQFLMVRKGFSGFAYYSWGAALFTFILYLTV